jgi:hypothetical protein
MTDKPSPTLLGTDPSFGFGDRLGLATPGHLEALLDSGGSIRGIFAQQSIREMTRTQRTPQEVMWAATKVLQESQFADPWGADADHLKTFVDAQRMLAAGYTFFTLDPSDFVDQQADHYDLETLGNKFSDVRDQTGWVDSYLGRSIDLGCGTIGFTPETVQRAAVKYGAAIQHAIELGKYVVQAAKHEQRPCELELSIDETLQPTTPAEHYIIVDQLRSAGVPLISLAPRFLGDFEKGIDYKGDLHLLEESLKEHVAISRELGPYKLSLHSGSDKISIYPLFARVTEGMFHVKTAGTSYLESLRVVARHDPEFFREIIDFSRTRFEEDKATYHVSAVLEQEPSTDDLSDMVELEKVYLQRWQDVPVGKGFTAPGRQILHCTFGSVLTHETLGSRLLQIVREQQDTYREVLREHFVRHLEALS